MPNSQSSTSKGGALSVVFTFNRPQYLRNIICSHRACAPEIPLLIIDDASTDPEQISLLEHMREVERIEVISALGAAHRHGGLYANMNIALKIAHDRGFRFLNLLQDDMQVVRPATEDILHACSLLEATNDALQVSLTFRKYLDVKSKPILSTVPDLYLSQTLHAADTGIIHLARAKEAGFTFQGSEREHSAKAKSLGLTNYVFRDPVVAFVPWPIYFRNRTGSGRQTPCAIAAGSKLRSIRTMSLPEINCLKDRDMALLPYMEDWCRPNNGCWIAPYNYTNSLNDWGRRIIRSMINGCGKRRLIPHLICATTPIRKPKTE